MLLVLISLMMATILTTAYLASRDNSAFIGANVAESAAARWAALTGVDVGVAVLETEHDWRNDHVDGNLYTDYALAGAELDLDAKDIETDGPPTSTTEFVELTSTADLGEATEVVVATAYVPLNDPGTVDVDLSEFAVFMQDNLDLRDDALITRWPMAPRTKTMPPIYLGTQDTSAGSINVSGDAAIVDGTVFHGPGASGSLVTVSSGPDVETQALLDTIPMPASPATGVAAPSAITYPALVVTPSTTLNASARHDYVEIKNGQTLTLQGANLTLVADKGLEIETNAKLIIDGSATIVLFTYLTATTSAIELKPGASLQMYIGGALTLTDAYIGEERGHNLRDNSGMAPWIEPTRLQVFSIPPRSTPVDWALNNNSVLKASVYAPDLNKLEIKNDSAIYGRVASTDVYLSGNGALFYDPSMNSGRGYTEPDSMLFAADDHIETSFKTLSSLSALDLQVAANLSMAKILGVRRGQSKFVPISLIEDGPGVVLVTEPHPRPIEVEYEMVTFGWDPEKYEDD
jgi:hypothetical protein